MILRNSQNKTVSRFFYDSRHLAFLKYRLLIAPDFLARCSLSRGLHSPQWGGSPEDVRFALEHNPKKIS
jgi:hypothetical protein